MEKVTYYRTGTEADYWDLADSLGIRNGKIKIDNFLRSMWEKHGNNTCVKVIEHDDGEITWEVELYKSVAMRGEIVRFHRKKETIDKERELQKYSEQISKKKEDLVNHPLHYNQYSQEVIDTIEEVTVNMPVTVAYHVGNAVKYLFRAPFKGKLKQDLEKAIWYLERAVNKL